MSFDRDTMRRQAAQLARQGVFIGTSSWKYEGWIGSLYEQARYEWRGRFAVTRFERNCLQEYSSVFKTVCVDAAYYAFPSPKFLENLASQVPEDFRFGLKVTDEITVKRFPNLARFGMRAGQQNPNFLNAELFARAFLEPCERLGARAGLFMFEFSRFYPADYSHGRDFVSDLDRFLGALPKGRPYGVEIRNRDWLQPDYFKVLKAHSVAHVFNSWEAMPPVEEQLALAGSMTRPNLAAARFLLRPGRAYEEAVKQFKPYNRVQDPNPEARRAGRALIEQRRAKPDGETYIYVNNRLEGNALETISAMIEGE